MWVRLQLDFGWNDFAYAMSQVFWNRHESASQAEITSHWPQGQALPVLSVRSGFDLLLGTMKWPAGGEIICSALNIPDMTMVARENGIVPVPADLDAEQLAPRLDLIERAITAKTQAILIAHLYGSFVPLEPILDLARRHGLMVIEDCAENFDGVYQGHPDADVSLFSFGPLKTATSLAGGILKTRDADLFARLVAAQDNWPVQSRWDYFNRLNKYGTMRFFGSKWLYGAVRSGIKMAVGDVDKLIHHTAKSFRPDEIMTRLRQRPCGPLLASMARRFACFDHERIEQRVANGRYLASQLRGRVPCPAADVESHNYWLFPALVREPAKAIVALEAAGFDATRAESMCAISAPADRSDLEPACAKELLDRMILLPCYPGIPEDELRRMADVLIEVEASSAHVEAMRATRQPADTTYEKVGRETDMIQEEAAAS